MKKEYWRKSRQCQKCKYYRPEGTRPDSIDPTTVWKESCRCAGYSFQQGLKEAEICFDFESFEKESSSEDKEMKELFVRQHLCFFCAFYDNNGLSVYVPIDENRRKSEESKELSKKEEWRNERRCRGYVHEEGIDIDCFCSSYLSWEQWAEIQSYPPGSEEKIRKWQELSASITS